MTPLSPQAQAVWNAWNDAYEAQGPLEDMGHPIAAAIRAVADQVVPVLTTAEGARIYDLIEAIAAELEALQ
jgi:hypothetical protein